jgi:hypothetical protein
MTKSRIKIVFPPETIAQIERDYPADQVQKVIDELTAAAQQSLDEDTGTVFDELHEEDPELLIALQAQMKRLGYSTLDEWFNAETEKPVLN